MQADQENFRTFSAKLPYLPIAMHATLSSIFEAVEGHRNIHIIDFGSPAELWASLLQQLSKTRNSCPSVRFTWARMKGDISLLRQDAESMAKILQRVALGLNISFQFSALSLQMENLHPSLFFCNQGETVVVNCSFYLHQFPDASVLRFNPRDKLLQVILRSFSCFCQFQRAGVPAVVWYFGE